MNKKKIFDTLYVIIFVVGIAFLIWFMASKNFWTLIGGLGFWALMPIVEKIEKQSKVSKSNDEKKVSD